jgi:hypothetical protein
MESVMRNATRALFAPIDRWFQVLPVSIVLVMLYRFIMGIDYRKDELWGRLLPLGMFAGAVFLVVGPISARGRAILQLPVRRSEMARLAWRTAVLVVPLFATVFAVAASYTPLWIGKPVTLRDSIVLWPALLGLAGTLMWIVEKKPRNILIEFGCVVGMFPLMLHLPLRVDEVGPAGIAALAITGLLTVQSYFDQVALLPWPLEAKVGDVVVMRKVALSNRAALKLWALAHLAFAYIVLGMVLVVITISTSVVLGDNSDPEPFDEAWSLFVWLVVIATALFCILASWLDVATQRPLRALPMTIHANCSRLLRNVVFSYGFMALVLLAAYSYLPSIPIWPPLTACWAGFGVSVLQVPFCYWPNARSVRISVTALSMLVAAVLTMPPWTGFHVDERLRIVFGAASAVCGYALLYAVLSRSSCAYKANISPDGMPGISI